MATRPTTRTLYRQLTRDARSELAADPAIELSELEQRLAASGSTIGRAFRAERSSFSRERRAAQLDRAAQTLLGRAHLERSAALLTATRAARRKRPRHLCEPFRQRYGVTPGRVHRTGQLIRRLAALVDGPAPHSRRDPRGYQRVRRRRLRLRNALRSELSLLTPGTVVADAVERALRDSDARQRRARQRARPRRRARRRQGR